MRTIGSAKSQAIAWLFLLAAVSTFGAETIRIRLDCVFDPPETGLRGVAAAAGAGGEIAVLVEPGSRLLLWNRVGGVSGEFLISDDRDVAPTDICSDGGFGFYAVDPRKSRLYPINRWGRALPPLPLDRAGELEPLSVCIDAQGRTFILNRRDEDVWRVERCGDASPILLNLQLGQNAGRIEYNRNRDEVWMLTGGFLRGYSTLDGRKRIFVSPVKNATSLAVSPDFIWVLGDALAGVSPNGLGVIFPQDSLAAWGVLPAVDVAWGGGRLVILGASGRAAAVAVDRISNGE